MEETLRLRLRVFFDFRGAARDMVRKYPLSAGMPFRRQDSSNRLYYDEKIFVSKMKEIDALYRILQNN